MHLFARSPTGKSVGLRAWVSIWNYNIIAITVTWVGLPE